MTDRLEKAGIRAFLNKANESIPKKIREAEKKKIPYIVVVGDKEVKDKKVAVRKRGLNKIKTPKAPAKRAKIWPKRSKRRKFQSRIRKSWMASGRVVKTSEAGLIQ